MNKEVIFIIEEYLFGLGEPIRYGYWPDYDFHKVSYSRWAATELLKIIKKNPEKDPVKLVREFAKKMSEYSKIKHEDHNDSFMFHIAYDVATDILDILK